MNKSIYGIMMALALIAFSTTAMAGGNEHMKSGAPVVIKKVPCPSGNCPQAGGHGAFKCLALPSHGQIADVVDLGNGMYEIIIVGPMAMAIHDVTEQPLTTMLASGEDPERPKAYNGTKWHYGAKIVMELYFDGNYHVIVNDRMVGPDGYFRGSMYLMFADGAHYVDLGECNWDNRMIRYRGGKCPSVAIVVEKARKLGEASNLKAISEAGLTKVATTGAFKPSTQEQPKLVNASAAQAQ